MGGVSNATLIGEVVIPGLLIVFVALVILIFVIWVMGKAISAIAERSAVAGASAPGLPAAPPVRVPDAMAGGVPEETIAVISAAIAAVMEESSPGVSYAITGVRRAKDSRPVWGFAGMQQNTRPF